MNKEYMEFRLKLQQEANRRSKILVEQCKLAPNSGGPIYDPRIIQIIEEFEHKKNATVYHCLQTGHLLNLLYVSPHEEDWETEQLAKDGWQFAYVYNLETEEESEFGYIRLVGDNGILSRVE